MVRDVQRRIKQRRSLFLYYCFTAKLVMGGPDKCAEIRGFGAGRESHKLAGRFALHYGATSLDCRIINISSCEGGARKFEGLRRTTMTARAQVDTARKGTPWSLGLLSGFQRAALRLARQARDGQAQDEGARGRRRVGLLAFPPAKRGLRYRAEQVSFRPRWSSVTGQDGWPGRLRARPNWAPIVSIQNVTVLVNR
jgi:hypothetical protein